MDPSGSQKLKALTKEHTQSGSKTPCTQVADVQLGLRVASKQQKRGLSQTLLPVCGIRSSRLTALNGLSGSRST